MRDQTKLLGAIFACACWLSAAAWGVENLRSGENAGLSDPDAGSRPRGIEDVERLDRFVILKEKLTTAVCDEKLASRPPSLESISGGTDEPRGNSYFSLQLPPDAPEHEIISFLLGDTLTGIQSDYVRAQAQLALRQRGLEAALVSKSLSADQFVEAQAIVAGVRRKVALDICEGLVNFAKLRQLLNAQPSRFLDCDPRPDPFVARDLGRKVGTPAPYKSDGAVVLDLIDREGRFGKVGDRKAAVATKVLIPGWLEPFEVARVRVRKGPGRIYRRVFNPLTNNTQSIEVANREGVPLGVLFLSHDPTAADWSLYRNWAELPEARSKQIESYRMRIEFDALQIVQARDADSKAVRDLQEFYKNLLQAYQLFPNEKQFEAYSRGNIKKLSLDDITRGALGGDFLAALRQARVNGSFVHIGLFKPDPKLHSIYQEYSERLAKLAKR